MPRDKQEETAQVHTPRLLKKCYDCVFWHMNNDGRRNGEVDFSTGRCDNNGYSKVPPLFTCNGWENGNGVNL